MQNIENPKNEFIKYVLVDEHGIMYYYNDDMGGIHEASDEAQASFFNTEAEAQNIIDMITDLEKMVKVSIKMVRVIVEMLWEDKKVEKVEKSS